MSPSHDALLDSNGSTQSPQASTNSQFAFVFPNEIQQLIFEHAAILDGRCAFNLCQVARHVYAWAFPILYERVVVRSPHSASCLFRTLRSKPRGYFEPMIKSLAFDCSVTLPQAKPLMAECSRRIILFSLFRTGECQHSFFEFVKSPYLRRLTLVCKRDWPAAGPLVSHHSPYEVPLALLSSVTHFTIVIDYECHSSWSSLTYACKATRLPHSASCVAAYSAFQNLTHFASSVKALRDTIRVKQVAKNLRCFAILEPRDFSVSEHRNLLARVRSQEHRGRSIVILRDLGDPDVWDINNSFGPSNFWRDAERLIEGGYMSDQGDRWPGYSS